MMRSNLSPQNNGSLQRALPWLVGALDAVMALACILLYYLTRGDLLSLTNTLSFALFPLAGAVIISRQPRNLAGWSAAAIGFLFGGADGLVHYARLALVVHPGSLPLGDIASWVGAWCWSWGYCLAILMILLVPNGQPPSRRWWIVVWAGAAITAPVAIWMMVITWPFRGVTLLQPDGGLSSIGETGRTVLRVFAIWQPLMILCIGLAVVGLFLRFGRSRGLERQQLKWILLACIFVPTTMAVSLLVGASTDPLLLFVNQTINLLSIAGFPVAFALAVTRYHLYDIDVIIRRTLVYSLLTVILALLYAGSVLLLQSLFTLVSGQQQPVGIVISTLFIAALFTPLRQRIQRVIDRRFYRSQYNASQMIEKFAASQRDLVNMEEIHAQVLQVVEETLQPEFVELSITRSRAASR